MGTRAEIKETAQTARETFKDLNRATPYLLGAVALATTSLVIIAISVTILLLIQLEMTNK